MDKENIAAMTGADMYSRKFSVSEISLNGDKGIFYYRDKETKKGDDGKFAKEEIGKELSVVFLKIRRVLSVYKKTGGLRTNEHNHKGDFVVLYGANDKGTAAEIRERHQELRTQQMVYAFYPPKKEVVRIVIKGASLGSENDSKDVVKFYDYLKTFGGDDHMHEYFTKLLTVGEDGPKGVYYAASFSRGVKLTEEQQSKVNAQIKEIHLAIQEMDENFKKRTIGGSGEIITAGADEDDEEMPTIQSEGPLEKHFQQDGSVEYPEEEINPEDIPF